jgi:hypothetical protein
MPKNKIFNNTSNQVVELSLNNAKWGGRSQNFEIKPRSAKPSPAKYTAVWGYEKY